jgi:hypothetical protein
MQKFKCSLTESFPFPALFEIGTFSPAGGLPWEEHRVARHMRFAATVALIVFACPVYATMIAFNLARAYDDPRDCRATFLMIMPIVALISACWAAAWLLIAQTTLLVLQAV